MSDFDPIEIEIAMNSPELILQSEQIQKSLGDVDAAVQKTENTFHSYLATKLKAQGIDVQDLRLKEQEIQKLQRYSTSIQQLKTQMDKTTDPTQLDVYKFKVDELQQKINTLLTNKANAKIIPNLEQQGVVLSKTKRKWDGLGNSINQITREGAAFTYSAQTGFLAISNNIPILADEILRVRLENQALTASGQAAVPVWKQVLKGFLSWQTLLSVGVTLLTVYGKEVGNWIASLLNGEKAIQKLTEAEKKLNEQKKKFRTSIVREYAELNILVGRMKSANITKEQWDVLLDKINKKYPFFLNNLNKEKANYKDIAGRLREVNKLYVTRIALQSQQKEIEAAFTTIADKKLKQGKDEIITEEKLQQISEKINKDRGRENRLTQIDLENKSYQEQIEIIKKSLVSEVNYFAQVSAIGGKNEALYTRRFNIRKSELDLIYKYEKANNRNRFAVDDENRKLEKKQQILTKLEKKHKVTLEELNKLFQVDVYKGGSEKATSERKKLINQLLTLDQEYTRKSYTKDQEEIQALKDKFSKIRKLVQAFNADKKNKANPISVAGLNALETNATDTLKYRQETKAIGKQLDQEKNLYAAYEAFKTKTSEAAAQKKYGKLIGNFKNYGEVLKDEYSKLEKQLAKKPKGEVTGAEQERLFALKERLDAFKNNQTKTEEKQFIDAYNSTITHKEQLLFIEQDFAARTLELDKIKDENLRKQKKTELAYQKKIAIDNANSEAYERTQIFEQLSADLLGTTKRELANRIASLEEYLKLSKGNLTEEQQAFVENEIKKAKAVQSATDSGIREKALLQEKFALEKRIAEQKSKGIVNVADEIDALEQINAELEDIFYSKIEALSGIASKYSAIFAKAAEDLKDVDDGLVDTLETMSELADVASSALMSFASFASGDIVGGITNAIAAIGGLFSMGAKARESERKAREEILKWQQELFNSQLAYNAEFRKRILDEVKLNDLYQSRVTNIKEQIAANKQNAAEVLKDQQAIFKRLLNMQVTVGKKTEKYGGFLGLSRKTRVVDIQKNIKDVLGYTGQLTDDIFLKLQKLNRDKPLTGDAREAYDELKKLRDEYGSIDEAIRNLEIQLKDTVTGTTAKSIADSIKQGIESGKKTFADFADDIEGFLRQAILSGMSAKILEPQMQELQDLLYNFLGDDILTADEKKQFQEMYLRIAKEASDYVDLINQTGIGIGTDVNTANSLKGAIKGITAEQADLLSGQFGGLRLTQLGTNVILKREFKNQLEQISKSVSVQLDIEKNTRRTADNTDKLGSIDTSLKDIKESIKPDNTGKANGI